MDNSMTVSLYDQIIFFLEKNAVPYELLEHVPVFTSEEAARVRHDLTLHQGAKAMIVRIKNYESRIGDTGRPSPEDSSSYLMCVLPGDRRIDFKKLKSLLQVKDTTLADPAEVERIVGVKIGAVSPFGNLSSLRVLLDQSLTDNELIVFNAGDHRKSVKMKLADYQRLVAPRLAAFTK